MIKLKPCPFCGSENISIVDCGWIGKAQCRGCGAKVVAASVCEDFEPKQNYWLDATAHKWNRRAE